MHIIVTDKIIQKLQTKPDGNHQEAFLDSILSLLINSESLLPLIDSLTPLFQAKCQSFIDEFKSLLIASTISKMVFFFNSSNLTSNDSPANTHP